MNDNIEYHWYEKNFLFKRVKPGQGRPPRNEGETRRCSTPARVSGGSVGRCWRTCSRCSKSTAGSRCLSTRQESADDTSWLNRFGWGEKLTATSISNIAFSGFDSSSTESNPITYCSAMISSILAVSFSTWRKLCKSGWEAGLMVASKRGWKRFLMMSSKLVIWLFNL